VTAVFNNFPVLSWCIKYGGGTCGWKRLSGMKQVSGPGGGRDKEMGHLMGTRSRHLAANTLSASLAD